MSMPRCPAEYCVAGATKGRTTRCSPATGHAQSPSETMLVARTKGAADATLTADTAETARAAGTANTDADTDTDADADADADPDPERPPADIPSPAQASASTSGSTSAETSAAAGGPNAGLPKNRIVQLIPTW